MNTSIREDVQGKLTTVQMIQRDGRACEIDLVSSGSDVDVLDELIRGLGAMRSQLTPAVADRFDDREPMQVVGHPPLTVGRTHRGDLLLAIRPPGFGWLTFGLSEEARMGLLEALESL